MSALGVWPGALVRVRSGEHRGAIARVTNCHESAEARGVVYCVALTADGATFITRARELEPVAEGTTE